MRKVIKILLIGAIIAFNLKAVVLAQTSGEFGNEFIWEFNDGKLVVRGNGDMPNWDSASSIPWSSKKYLIEEVVISDGITSIGDKAFRGCEKLKSIKISNSVTQIGVEAFYGCTNLLEIKWSSKLENIKKRAFGNCESLQSLEIPTSVRIIEFEAFDGCSAITDLYISDSVVEIGDWAFSSCSKLSYVRIGANVQKIGSRSFFYCYNLKRFDVSSKNGYYSNDGEGVLFNKQKTVLVRYPVGKKTTEYKIDKNVIEIGDLAFANCATLNKIEIQEGMVAIRDHAFYDCFGLETVELPNTMTTIENYAFFFCVNLRNIVLPRGIQKIGIAAAGECESLENVYYKGTKQEWMEVEGNKNLPIAKILFYSKPAEVEFKNYGKEPVNILFATYGAKSKMLDIVKKTIENTNKETVAVDSETEKYKILYWDSLANLKPVYAPIEKEL